MDVEGFKRVLSNCQDFDTDSWLLTIEIVICFICKVKFRFNLLFVNKT